jgi:hypothetical protein
VNQSEQGLDERAAQFAYGDGGVPWYLLAGYLLFLVFFTWYVLEYQLPDYLRQGPGRAKPTAEAAR